MPVYFERNKNKRTVKNCTTVSGHRFRWAWHLQIIGNNEMPLRTMDYKFEGSRRMENKEQTGTFSDLAVTGLYRKQLSSKVPMGEGEAYTVGDRLTNIIRSKTMFANRIVR
jgi:hypothetical protein